MLTKILLKDAEHVAREPRLGRFRRKVKRGRKAFDCRERRLRCRQRLVWMGRPLGVLELLQLRDDNVANCRADADADSDFKRNRDVGEWARHGVAAPLLVRDLLYDALEGILNR